MYEYAIGLEDPTEAWKWLCAAAHQGSAEARFALGSHYRWGRTPVSQDFVSAYLWHKLGIAAGSKRAPKALELLKREMSAGQITEAERLVDQWTPDPSECGVMDMQAGN